MSSSLHRILLRQLRRSLQLDSDEAALALLAAAREHAAEAPGPVALLAAGLGTLLDRVSATYDQNDRDLALRDRSLSLSTAELSSANAALRLNLATRARAIRSLRDTMAGMRQDLAIPPNDDPDDIEALSRGLADLVTALTRERNQFQQQKFALDQHAIVSITDVTGRIVYANDELCRISGYRRDELLGQNHRVVRSGLHDPALYREMWTTIASGAVWKHQLCNRNRNGVYYWVEATIVPLLDPKGVPESYISIQTEISHTKALEASLKEQLQFTETLVEAFPVAVYHKDRSGHYLRVNAAFEALLGISRDRCLERGISSLQLPPEEAAFHTRKDEEIFAGLEIRQSYAATIRRPDGRVCECLYHKIGLTRPDGEVGSLLGVIIDVSDLRATEKALRAAKEAAESANRAKSVFLATMSHEIRTPMNGIIGMTELAMGTPDPAEQREHLETVKASADALLTIINDILDFSKIEAGRLDIETLPYNLRHAIAPAVSTLGMTARAKGLRLIQEVDDTLPETLQGDPVRITQILTNLVGNAIKFTQEGEVRLSIASSPPGPEEQPLLVITVQDTGIGIAPNRLESIFDPFTQEDSSVTRRFGGTGLGLAISRKLASLMGGWLEAESSQGEGSTFVLSLPLILPDGEAGPADVTREPAHGPEVGGPTLDILLAEDNPVNQKVATLTLQRLGHQVTLAQNGRQAVALALGRHDRPYDLILMDMQMPTLDGLEATRQLRRQRYAAPIIAMTANAMAEDRERCLEAGMNDFLTKPIRRDELLDRLQRLASDRPGLGEAAPPAPATKAAFDYGSALRNMSQEILEIIRGPMLAQIPKDMDGLHRAVATGDNQATRHHAHALRGALANVPGIPLPDMAWDMEQQARDGASDNELQASLDSFDLEIRRLMSALAADSN